MSCGPLNIAQVVGASPYGGGTVCILQWSQRLIERGHRVTIQANDPKTRQAAQAIGAQVVRIPGMTRPIRPQLDAAAVMALAWWLRRERFDVVHTHTSKAGFVGRLAARLAGVPVVVHTVHGFAFHEFTPPARLRVYAALERLAARWCDRIITVSQAHADWAARLGIGRPGQVVAVPNGIAPRPFPDPAHRAQVRRDLGITNDAILLLSVGRLEPQKNQVDLLRAMNALGARLGGALLAIAGEGPLHDALSARIAELGLTGRCRLLGFRRDVPDLLAAADAFVLSSLWEGTPIVLLEAMAAGLPVVANRIMGNREVVADGETGYLVPPRRPDFLAEALCRLFADPAQARAMGLAGRLRLERQFTLARTLSRLEDVYDDLLSRRLARRL
jgi:glycosyltransferase involved in cell wall biosynthesis